MKPINKAALRAAVLIHEQLAGGPRYEWPVYFPEYAWNNIQRCRRQIDLARQRGWHGAAKQLIADLAGTLDDCRRQLENACHTLQSNPHKRNAASTSDLYRDILALDDEFEGVKIDLGKHELAVTTDRIVLEDIYFGPFEIRLDWRQLGLATPYRVVAMDPHPAAKDSGRHSSPRPGGAALRGRRPQRRPGRAGRRPAVRFLCAGFSNSPHLRPGQRLRGTGPLGWHSLRRLQCADRRRRPRLLRPLRQYALQ